MLMVDASVKISEIFLLFPPFRFPILSSGSLPFMERCAIDKGVACCLYNQTYKPS